MSASEDSRAEWLDSKFWERLEQVESRHQRVQSQHEQVRRGLDRVSREESAQLHEAWDRYCEVIAELDRATADLETLRTHPP
jgi:hypothetical protein